MNDLNDSLLKYSEQLKSVLNRYGAYVYLLVVAVIIAFLMLRISSLINAEPDITKIETVKQININKEQADKMRGLQDLNITVDPNETDGRTNPFQ